jgi:hypothetical protein
MKKIVIIAMGLVASATALAQDKVEATIAADFVSQYIWRGIDCGHVSIQPTLGIAYRGFSLEAWGSVGFKSEDTKEFDLTASYTTGGLTVAVTDYWFDDPESRYFYYNSHSTSHLFEASVAYDFGLLSAAWYTNFAGNDGLTLSGKRAYSSYVELNAPFRLATCEWTGTVGAVPYATTFCDTSGFAVTNIALKASKDIKITDTFSIPLFAQVIANPSSQKAYFVVGFTLQP